MIQTENEKIKYRTKFFNKDHFSFSDTTFEKGGSNSGFRPHELLEAALASCMNMHIRMFAESYGINFSRVKTEVLLNRNEPEVAVFEYKFKVEGNLTEIEKEKIVKIMQTCPVKKTLSKKIEFKYIE